MMAFCLWAEGFAKKEKLEDMKTYPPGRFEIIADEWKVDRCKIPDYFTSEFWHNLNIWTICKNRGLPYLKGWAEHPAPLIQLLQIFDAAETKTINGSSGRTNSRNQS